MNSVLTDNLLNEAIEIYESNWLFSEKFDESKFITSEKFNKKIQRIIKSRNNIYYKVTLTGMRRTICVFVAIIVLFCCSLSVGAVRNAIKEFFINTFATHDRITANVENTKEYPETLEKIYELGYVPSGFELVDSSVDTSNATYMYASNDSMIIFMQDVKTVYSSNIDNENSLKSIETHNNQEYVIYTWENSEDIKIILDNGEYIFSLSGNLNKNEAIKMCNSLKIKNK